MCVGNSQENTEHNVYVLIQPYILNGVLYFIKYSCTNTFHRRSLYTFCAKLCLPSCYSQVANCCKGSHSWKAMFDRGQLSHFLQCCPAASPVWQQKGRAWSHMSGYLEGIRGTSHSSSRKGYHMEIQIPCNGATSEISVMRQQPILHWFHLQLAAGYDCLLARILLYNCRGWVGGWWWWWFVDILLNLLFHNLG